MKKLLVLISIICPLLIILTAETAYSQRYMEKLNRGLVAINTGSSYYLSWRLFGTDLQDNSFGFNIYKGTTKLNANAITNATCYQDNTPGTGVYTVKPVSSGTEGIASETAKILTTNFLTIPLTPPPGGTTPDGVAFSERPNDASVGDLNGDGEYDIVLKWDPTNSKDNSQSGFTGNTFLDGYTLDGTRLWRIDLGINIRSGAHYPQFMVYDLDGDGIAEIACKTAPGTKDGTGQYLKTGPAAGANNTTDYRNYTTGNGYGSVLLGPEWYTIFNGTTGGELVTVSYKPARGTVSAWGDNYGNRVDRFLAGIAYLDGTRPSLVTCRGYYTRSTLWALDWRNGKLTERWFYDSDAAGNGKDGKTNKSYAGQGCHSLRMGDADGDGFDEIVYGSCTIDHDGKGLYNTGLNHGDALHLSDMAPDRPGLEVWQVHEDAANNGNIAASFRDAKTGTSIWADAGTKDNGRGCCAPLVAGVKGWQMWSGAGGLWNASHTSAGNKPGSSNFALWWDGGLLRATEDSISITPYTGSILLFAAGCTSNNGTKSTPCLTADIFGDWREEIIYRAADNKSLRIYTTTIPTTNRLYTLMHDPIYRLSVASENVAYNQPPEPGIYIGYGMTLPETKPNITYYTLSTALSNRTTHINAAVPENIVMMAFGNQKTILPATLNGKPKTVQLFDLGGRLIAKRFTNSNVIDTRNDFGILGGIYMVRVTTGQTTGK